MDQIDSAQYFSTIDLRNGYHQMRIAEKDIPKLLSAQDTATMRTLSFHSD